jgi:hypothetical protein
LPKSDDAERAVQLGKLTPHHYQDYLQRRAENTEQPSTGTTAVQFAAIATLEKAAAIATTVTMDAPEKAVAEEADYDQDDDEQSDTDDVEQTVASSSLEERALEVPASYFGGA